MLLPPGHPSWTQSDTLLPLQPVGRYRAKQTEYGTQNRTYCHNPSCSTFVPPRFIRGSTATCVKCHNITYTGCKGRLHDGDCPLDAATLNMPRLENARGWQRCASCRKLVKFSSVITSVRCVPRLCDIYSNGTIACLCDRQFCCVCRERWRTCGFVQWHQNQPFDRATAVVHRDATERMWQHDQF